MKAEPDSRVVKNQDVKVRAAVSRVLNPPRDRRLQFSVDDFERVGTTPWEGVRNHEAKNLMMQMRIGDRVGDWGFLLVAVQSFGS
jgi:protein phosphatase-4 regulatory subunit 3